MAHSDLNLVIMAAGSGRRFGGLKQLEGFGPGGETLMDYAIYDGLQAGVGHVVLVINPEHEAEFQSSIVKPWSGRLDIQLAAQRLDDLPILPVNGPGPAARHKPWGTGQALWAARHAVDGPMIVCNADDCYGQAAYSGMARFLRDNPSAQTFALQGYDLGETLPSDAGFSRGFCTVSKEGFLEEIVEHLDVKRNDVPVGEQLVSMNFWGFTPGVFPLLEEEFQAFLAAEGGNPASEFFLPTVIQAGLVQNRCRVRVRPACSPWFGVTNREDSASVSARLDQLHQDGTYPEDLRS